LNVIVSRLPRVLEKGISGPNQSLENNYNNYVASSDPIRAFVEKCIIIGKGNNELKTTVYNAFYNFCIAKQLNPESSTAFSNRLTKVYDFKIERLQRSKVKDYYWLDIKLKDWRVAEAGQETL
jgi:phage/plasmid-associated DNA primase